MDCQIVFYMSQKTGYCEKVLQKKLEHTELNIAAASSAATVRSLGECLAAAVDAYDLVIIIGGLSQNGSGNIVQVLSRAFSHTSADLVIKKILSPNNGDDGYILESGNQIILVLPDDPEQLKSMVGNSLLKYISSAFKLSYTPVNTNNDIDSMLKIQKDGILSTASPKSEKSKRRSNIDYKKRSNTWLYILIAVSVIIIACILICDFFVLKKV